MARLPTVSDFGGRPVPGNQRNVVPIQHALAMHEPVTIEIEDRDR